MTKATIDSLDDLHGALARALAEKIKSGEATAADMAVARQFLKDNGIDAIPTTSNGLGELAHALPFPTKEEVEEDSSSQPFKH